VERIIETLLYRSRWLLAPIYFGLSIAILVLGIKFFFEVYHLLANVLVISDTKMILVILTLIDIAMVGGLLIMVMVSGYENFVSQINVGPDEERLGWLGKMDASSLKAKIAANIVAISSIHLLKIFMDAESIDNDKLLMYVVIHMTFVVSACLMGYLDSLVKH
jgi:uncharacterized protein (TIGR00645 family)